MIPNLLKDLVSSFDGLFELLGLVLGLQTTVTRCYIAVIYVLTSKVLNKAASFAGSGVGLAGGIWSGRVQVQASSADLSLEPSHAAAALPAISGNYCYSVNRPQSLFWSNHARHALGAMSATVSEAADRPLVTDHYAKGSFHARSSSFSSRSMGRAAGNAGMHVRFGCIPARRQ
jgi:hypothetical protein